MALDRLSKDLKSKSPQFYEYYIKNKETLLNFGKLKNDRILNSTEQISPIITYMNNLNNETKNKMHEYLKE